MSDTYQAVYDAVRSRIGNPDVAAAVSDAIGIHAQGLSYAIEAIKHEYVNAAMAQQRPCVLYRPAVSIDGDHWCALYGENLQDGVAGFGKSVEMAMQDFDSNWHKQLPAAQAGVAVVLKGGE